MLSYYDTLSFSLRKQSFLIGFGISLVMLVLFLLVGFSLENQYGLFTSYRDLLQAGFEMDKVHKAFSIGVASGKIVTALTEPAFMGIVVTRLLQVSFLFIVLSFLFFSLQMIIAKKELFQPNVHSAVFSFFSALIKMMILLSPILAVIYIALERTLPHIVKFFIEQILSGENPLNVFLKNLVTKNVVAIQPLFDKTICISCAVGLFIYFVYVFSLFIERFSFKSLANAKVFFKHILTVIEMIFQMVMSVVLLAGLIALVTFCLWQLNILYVCFFALLIYFVCTVTSPARWIFITFFMVVAAMCFALNAFVGPFVFRANIVYYLVDILTYFSFFFVFSIFWSAIAYSFASTAYVFRFNQTPSKDVKEQEPEKLRQIDELYNNYLKEHKNDVQDNFFHHLGN